MARLDAHRWAAVQPLFEHAIDLPPGQRASFLSGLRHEDASLHDDLAALLAHHDAGIDEHFLDAGPLDGGDHELHPGQALGAYTLVSPIGRGGMGSVWLAERSDGSFTRKAAIKFLNVALRGRGKERFTREGRILGRLTHPRIAHLLDAGVTPAGRPYLVLEFVDGVPIDQYCERHQLDLHARVRLFLEVLDAVGHAHANLIVHRDIKPSNVLVGTDGHVKLLDFGIAKLLDAEAAGAAMVTREGDVAMTPHFATPEQVSGGAITTATDIYQLGVLLYVLLTRRHPAEPNMKSPVDLMRAIVDVEPPPPSAVVSHPRAARLLRGDLDTIVGKSLRKTPSDRYSSVPAFAADLQRHLDHQPIEARPASVAYRAMKFVRRHRWPVAAAAMLIAALAAGLYAVNRERIVAERRFAQLRSLSREVFNLDTQVRNLPGATKAREQLVAVSLQYLEGLAADSQSDLDLTVDVAAGYWLVARIQGVPTEPSLGDLGRAEASLAKSEALLASVLARRAHHRNALFYSSAVSSDRAVVADTERRDADARAHAINAVKNTEALLALGNPTDPELEEAARTFGNMALAHVNMHDYAEGARLAQRQVDISRLPRVNPRHLPFALSVLANALRLQGELDRSLAAIREARTLLENVPYPSETARMLVRYSIVMREGLILGEDRAPSLEHSAEAVATLREAFDMTEGAARRDRNDSTSRARVGTSARELANILRWQDPEGALGYYDVAAHRLAEITNNVKAHRDRALTLAGSSYPLVRLHRNHEAKARLSDALAILQQTKDYPAERLEIGGEAAVVLQAHADFEAAEGRTARAIELYRDLLARIAASAPDTENDLRTAYSLALLYRNLRALHQRHGDEAGAGELDAKIHALWEAWNTKQPNNQLVLRELARR